MSFRRSAALLLGVICCAAITVVAPPVAHAVKPPSGLRVQGGSAFDTLKLSWKWSKKPTSYRVQVSESKKFESAVKREVPNRRSRPSGGRQTYRVTGLNDGTRFFVRIAAVKNGKRSAWSKAVKGATRARFPSPAKYVRSEPGPGPGEVTFTWKTAGDYTDFFKLQTATTPFEQGARDRTVFKIDPDLRKYTLTAEQTEAAGAGIGVGWSLVWRFHAINTGTADTTDRYFGQGQSRVPGAPPEGTGKPIRVAAYNVRVDDTFDRRAPLIAKTIKDHGPGIVLLTELFPSVLKDFKKAMADRSLSHYRLTRESPVKTGATGEKKLQSRLLYDTTQYEMVSDCPDDQYSTACLLTFESDGGPDYAAYARMRELATGQEFWIASFHLTNGNKFEQLRTQAMRDILDGLSDLNEGLDLPIIVGGDSNSSQLRPGTRPHDVLMQRGYYDTASAVTQVNAEYGTHNGFEYQEPSKFGISPRIDLIATLGMPGSQKFHNVVVDPPDPIPSDHNLIYADLRLPTPTS